MDMTNSSDRLNLIEALIQQSVVASNERMLRLEQNISTVRSADGSKSA
ncbi:hypothetical protein ABN584_09295 [Gloeocapsa sp. BRSZ]